MASKNVNKEQLDKWKKEHKHILKIEIDGHVGYIKQPDRNTIGLATSFLGKNNVKFVETIFQNCWLGGDEMIREDDSLFFSCVTLFNEIIELKAGKLVKL